jgi:dTDP-4-dehydrorhamnose 3,5-epimerase
MPFEETGIAGLVLYRPRVFEDNRGYFFESYNQALFEEAGHTYQWVQDNQSGSSKHVVRGLHFQTGEYAQAKLVRVLSGAVWDVAVDLRPGSDTYGQWRGFEISAVNRMQLLIPRGFAHGFSVLSERAEFSYKCDNLYSASHESGIHPLDPGLAIDWKVDEEHMILSEKDAELPFLENLVS